MKCLCPACGRTTDIENELLEFFARCDRCGILLRPRPTNVNVLADDDGATSKPAKPVTAKIVPIGRVREEPANANGRLADLLSRPLRSAVPAPRPAPAPVPPPAPAEMAVGPMVTLYKTAIRRAQLRQHHQVLGVAGIFGLALFAFLAIGALWLKSHAGPVAAHADVISASAPSMPQPSADAPPQASKPR